jgi:hypothetical protein
MGLVQDEEMLPALAAEGADHPLREGVLSGRSGAIVTRWIPLWATRRVKTSL